MAGRAGLGGVGGMAEAGALDPVLLQLNGHDTSGDPVAGLFRDFATDDLMTFHAMLVIRKDKFVCARHLRTDPFGAHGAFLRPD